MKTTLTYFFSALFVVLLSVQDVLAKTSEEFATILNLSGRQRMLTQKMSKEMLLIAKGIDAEQNRQALQSTAALYDSTLIGLKNGDSALGLPPTDQRSTLKIIARVEGMWAEFKAMTDSVVAGGSVSVADVAAQNGPLLKNSNTMVRLYEKEARNATGKSSGIVINLAGKQRMLTQKMTKEALLVALGHDVDNTQASLRATINLFDRTLSGLLSGDADLELPGTDDPAIVAQLSVVSGLWQEFKPLIEQISEGSTSPSALQSIAEKNLPLLVEMNKAVSLFEKAGA